MLLFLQEARTVHSTSKYQPTCAQNEQGSPSENQEGVGSENPGKHSGMARVLSHEVYCTRVTADPAAHSPGCSFSLSWLTFFMIDIHIFSLDSLHIHIYNIKHVCLLLIVVIHTERVSKTHKTEIVIAHFLLLSVSFVSLSLIHGVHLNQILGSNIYLVLFQ